MTSAARAIVECVDSCALAVIKQLNLPTFGDWLSWEQRLVELRAPLSRGTIVFVVAGEGRGSEVARRVARYRAADQFALGICPGSANGSELSRGVIRLAPGAWKDGLGVLLSFVVAPLAEGVPEVIVCTDWGDVARALEAPGELIFAWSCKHTNAHAFQVTFRSLQARLSGRQCRSLICLMRGGEYAWLKELRAALRACRRILSPDGVILGGDAIAPFGNHAGCGVLAVADCRGPLK